MIKEPIPEGLLHRTNRIVAIVDLVGSVAHYENDEAGTVRRWAAFVAKLDDTVRGRHGGRLVKSTGDGFILEFDDVHATLRCMTELHQGCAIENAAVPLGSPFSLRIGVHLADVYVDQSDIYGRGVNLAARLASIAQPGDTILSGAIRDAHVPGIDPDIEDIGPVFFKNAVVPVPAYRIVETKESPRARRSALPIVPPLVPTIAIIPFKGLFVSETDDAVGELLADLLIARLSIGGKTRVISRLSTSRLRMKTIEHSEVRRLLGSDYALTGSYRMTDRRISLIAELADTRDGAVLWIKEFQSSVEDLVSQDPEIVGRISEQIVLDLTRHALERVRSLPLPSLDGFALQLAAVAMMHRTSLGEFNRSREALDHLIDRYPTAPEPRAWLAKWYVLRFTRGHVGVEDAEAEVALDQTRRALDGNPDFALALAMESFVRMHLLRDLDLAERRLADALSANPNEPLAWLFSSVCQQFRGNGRPAVQAAEKAISLSPIDPLRHYFDSLGSSAALAAEDYERAIELATKSLLLNRRHPPALRTLAISQVETGQIIAARETVKRIMELDPDLTIKNYMARTPKGAGSNRTRYARALRQAGVPMG